ncbi:aspartyl protease family protein 1-like [Castanea sativa]|uniref:aspartyl protease family protein 1-like n=1 Tax=Castanea sativa TaxID=21020 RepID=UPI003F64C1E6
MSWALSYTSSYSFTFESCTLLIILLLLGLSSQSCNGLGTFGFDIHHQFSDTVKAILGADGLPEKGSVEYYAAMASRDRIIQGRHLAASKNQSPLTFANGNNTLTDLSLSFLYYANVSVGTPSLSFLVALDTGSGLFWLPCDCQKNIAVGCSTYTYLSSGEEINLNIYSPSASSTSEKAPCDISTLCDQNQCLSASSDCAYKYYYADGSSNSGILVEDVLHLITDDNHLKAVEPQITFGCAQNLVDGTVNGLLGLGIDDLSVPSILARKGLGSNSFSMCFGADHEHRRITFGDTGSSDQKEAPFTIYQSNFYNININQITVGSNVSELDFSAIFDSGTTYTYLKDPAYTFISMSFDSQVKEYRSDNQNTGFEYCYNSSNFPEISLKLQGGNEYVVTNPVEPGNDQGTYCLAISKIDSGDNIIGQNFMTGYHIVFNREKKVIGWKASDCGYNPSQSPPTPDGNSNSPPTNPSQSPPFSPPLAGSPGNDSHIPIAPLFSHSPELKSFTYTLMMLLVSFFAIV